MSRAFLNRAKAQTAEWNLFSQYMGDRGLVADLGRDLSTLQSALPLLYRSIANVTGGCAEWMDVHSEEAQKTSLQACLQVLARLWTASRGKTLGVDCAHFIRFARRFTDRLLEACDQSLQRALSRLKQGDSASDFLHGESPIHLAQVASALALWEIKWILLDATQGKVRSIHVLRQVLELLEHVTTDALTQRQLLDSRYQLTLASLLYVAKLDTLQHAQIHRACDLLQDIPRHVLLACFDVGERPPGPYIVFAFNDVSLRLVNVTGLSRRLSIRAAPIQAHLMAQTARDGYLSEADAECLASLLGQLHVDGSHHQRVIGRRQFVRVSLGASNIVHKRQEWLEFLPSAEEESHGRHGNMPDVGALRVSDRLLSRQCSGNIVAIQLDQLEGLRLCLITSVATEEDGSNKLQLKLLSNDWFVDRARLLNVPPRTSSQFLHDIIFAKSVENANELLVIMVIDDAVPKLVTQLAGFHLKSSGKVFERTGYPKQLWGATCIRVLPAKPMSNTITPLAPFLLKSNRAMPLHESHPDMKNI